MATVLYRPQRPSHNRKHNFHNLSCQLQSSNKIIQYMGQISSPSQDPTTVDFFKIHENAYDTKTREFGSEVLYKNNMTWDVQIPSNLKAGNCNMQQGLVGLLTDLGDYIIRHELIALHYATKELGPEFYVSCLNVKITGDGTAIPEKVNTGRFPGAYKIDDPYLNFDLHSHENIYVSLSDVSPCGILCFFNPKRTYRFLPAPKSGKVPSTVLHKAIALLLMKLGSARDLSGRHM
jgi:hypothetical protein